MSMIASSVPGRIRLRHELLRRKPALERLRSAVAVWPPVRAVKANSVNGSLTVHYDPSATEPGRFAGELLDAARQLVGAVQPPGPPPVPPSAPGSARTAGPGGDAAPRRVRANRWAKRGMLGSLALSLLLAAGGGKRGHALAGIAFLHALAAHLWVHRRRLLK